MRIVIPLVAGKLSAHFGHCEQFALIDVDPDTKEITAQQFLDPPPHEPGALPPWLAEQGAEVIIAGGIGGRAQQLFAGHGSQVVIGTATDDPETIVRAYLSGDLPTGDNLCDH